MPPERIEILAVDDAGNPVALTSPVIRMEKEDDPALTVDLFAAIHFADPGYYEELNRRFVQYDAVLVEMIAPKGTKLAQIAAPSARKTAIFSRIGFLETLQRSMGNALGLANQLDAIDYAAPNMVLADMDAETLFTRISENGEVGQFLRETFLGEDSGETGTPSAAEENLPEPASHWIDFLLARDKQKFVRRVFAVELAHSLNEGKTPFEKSLIRDRNTIVLGELARQIEMGKKKIAVFYGSAHIPDIQTRLEDAGFRVTGTDQIVAWRL